MIPHSIADSGTKVQASVQKIDKDNSLVVATQPLKTYEPVTIFARNDIYGIEMNHDGSYGGTPVLIHNGTDSAAWTMSEPVGTKWVADSTDQPYQGSKSLKCDNPKVNDVMQVINNVGPGTDIDMSGYVALTMWIYVASDWALGDSFSLYAFVDGALVGNAVLLEDYFDYTNYDVYQLITIPLTDLGIEASLVDAFRIENAARTGAKSPLFYIDNWYLQETGTPIVYEIKPRPGTWLYIDSIMTTFVDIYTEDAGAVTMPSLSYWKILAMTPDSGYLYERYSAESDKPIVSRRYLGIADILQYPGARIASSASGVMYIGGTPYTGTMLCIENQQCQPLLLKSENKDRIVITLEDVFSELVRFRIAASGREETR